MVTLGSAGGTYSIDFQAGSPGQALTVTYTITDYIGGDITLEAAAITAKHPDVAITQPAPDQILNAPATFTASVQASQEIANINGVSLLQDNNLLLTLPNLPFDFPIGNLAPGNYVFTAQATDSNGLSQSSQDRKSTRLNSSHLVISYAVFCLKTKKKQ